MKEMCLSVKVYYYNEIVAVRRWKWRPSLFDGLLQWYSPHLLIFCWRHAERSHRACPFILFDNVWQQYKSKERETQWKIAIKLIIAAKDWRHKRPKIVISYSRSITRHYKAKHSNFRWIFTLYFHSHGIVGTRLAIRGETLRSAVQTRASFARACLPFVSVSVGESVVSASRRGRDAFRTTRSFVMNQFFMLQ